MINYHKSKIYAIINASNNNILYVGGTVSQLNRRYYNHRYNENNALNKYMKDHNIDWTNIRIELIKEYPFCFNRAQLRFASDIVTAYIMDDNPDVLEYYLNNINDV